MDDTQVFSVQRLYFGHTQSGHWALTTRQQQKQLGQLVHYTHTLTHDDARARVERERERLEICCLDGWWWWWWWMANAKTPNVKKNTHWIRRRTVTHTPPPTHDTGIHGRNSVGVEDARSGGWICLCSCACVCVCDVGHACGVRVFVGVCVVFT